MQVSSFPCLANSECNQIILGSMPGVESIHLQQYYAHPRNQFWRIFYALHDCVPSTNYEERTAFILSKRTALWDVISHCERIGSLDTDIQNPIMNDFIHLFSKFPNIRTLYFNGGKAYDLFLRFAAQNLMLKGYSCYKLPSSSPAYTLSFENKLIKWKDIFTEKIPFII
jgi:TDG/mug DNA glycosylase family protein